MTIISAGLLMYRIIDSHLEVFLAHPGGPYYKGKDSGYWGIPKGQVEETESYFDAALREFNEETGIAPQGTFIPLDWVKHSSGKIVYAWAFPAGQESMKPIQSNTFELEWPPRSGCIQQFPEIDRAEFFTVHTARNKIIPVQAAFIDRLKSYLANRKHLAG